MNHLQLRVQKSNVLRSSGRRSERLDRADVIIFSRRFYKHAHGEAFTGSAV